MTTTHTPTSRSARGRLTVAAALIAITAALMAGCSGEDGEPTAASTAPRTPAQAQQWDPGDPPRTIEPTAATPSSALPDAAAELDRSNPDAVSQAAVQIWFSWDTATSRKRSARESSVSP